jgi:hypothetical protein
VYPLQVTEETAITPYEEMEPQRLAFLYELYQRSAGDPRQGVPYEELIDALRFGERVTKSIQLALQQEGLVALTAIPLITTAGRPVMNPAHRRSCGQTIGITAHGARVIEDIVAHCTPTEPATPRPARLS